MKKLFWMLLMCFFTLPVFAKNTILVIGDSLSAGYGIDPNQGWVALLRSRLQEQGLDYDVINSSISGETSSQGLARLPDALKQVKPHITIIELGANDGLRGLPIATIQDNLQQMISLAQNANSQVLLIGLRLPPNYGTAYTEQFQKIYSELAQKNHIPVVSLFLQNVDENSQLLQADRIHPTAKAQIILLDNIWPALEIILKK